MESEPIELATVATRGDFVSFISEFAETAADYSGELEEFLRSVLRVALPHQEEQPSWRLLAQIISDALTTPPLSFDPTWLAHKDWPAVTGAGQFSDVREMLSWQIADLHRMTENGKINDPDRYFGIDGDGPRWYNFEPAGFLECASAGMRAHGDLDGTECKWDDLIRFLVLGQIYE